MCPKIGIWRFSAKQIVPKYEQGCGFSQLTAVTDVSLGIIIEEDLEVVKVYSEGGKIKVSKTLVPDRQRKGGNHFWWTRGAW